MREGNDKRDESLSHPQPSLDAGGDARVKTFDWYPSNVSSKKIMAVLLQGPCNTFRRLIGMSLGLKSTSREISSHKILILLIDRSIYFNQNEAKRPVGQKVGKTEDKVGERASGRDVK